MTEKQQEAREIVKHYMWYSAGAGLIPIQFVDGIAVTGLQLKMLAEISKIYDVPFQKNLGKAAIGTLAGFAIPHAAAWGALGKAVPALSVLGAPLVAAFAGAYSWALGNIFIQHFESGGTFLTFDAERVKEHFKAQFASKQTVTPVVEA